MRGGGHSGEVRPLGAGTLPELQDFFHVSRHLQLARPKAAPPRLPILISAPFLFSPATQTFPSNPYFFFQF